MFDYDKWQEIFGTIRKNKLRTFLTALGVFWGIFMLIVLMGAGTGLQNGVFALFGSHARNALYIGVSSSTMPYLGLPAGRRVRLNMDDIRAIKNEFPKEIEYMAPRLWLNSGVVARKGLTGAFELRGESPEVVKIDAFKLKSGRFINKNDLVERRKVVVIGQKVKSQLFKEDEEAIGDWLNIRGADYLIVGEIQSDRTNANDADEDEKTIFMPLTTAQQITNRHQNIGMFVCTIDPAYSVSDVEPRVKSLLKKRHKIHPDDPRGFWSDNIEEEVKEIMGLFIGIKFLVWFVGVGSLLFGILGVGNIMLIIVKDRTKEIGIRKALGATPKSIVSMILLESAFITTLAGYLGLVFSIGLVWLMKIAAGDSVNMFQNPEIDLGVGIGATVILVLAGTLTGFVPAMQAAKINPVEALKDE